jgi:DNA-binding NarL/FixJ family response regulator
MRRHEEEPSVDDKPLSLSRRQRQVLALIAEGATDNEIAFPLCLSAETVAWHVRRIRARLHARSLALAVALALREGLLSGDLIGTQPG